jgi:hypothetical protein
MRRQYNKHAGWNLLCAAKKKQRTPDEASQKKIDLIMLRRYVMHLYYAEGM